MFKFIVLITLLALTFAQLCPQKVLNACKTDIQKGNICLYSAVNNCEEAAKEKGADQTADINCVKYLLSARKDCWPCVCEIAKQEGWKIKGCDLINELIEAFNKIQN